MKTIFNNQCIFVLCIFIGTCSVLRSQQETKLDYTVSQFLDNASRPETNSFDLEQNIYRNEKGQERGWHYEYYEGNWDRVPPFDDLEPEQSGTAERISIEEVDHREDQFAVRFSGFLVLNDATEIQTALTSDDGSILWINGNKIIDNDGKHAPETVRGSIELDSGVHEVVVGYFESGGGETVALGESTQWPHVQTWIQSLDAAPDGTVYTTAGWDEAHHESSVYRNGHVLPQYKRGGGTAITVDADHVYVDRNDQVEKFERHNYTPVNFTKRGSNTLNVDPDWGLEVHEDHLYISSGAGKPVQVYHKKTGEHLNELGEFQNTIEREEIPLHLAASEQGVWCIKGMIDRTIQKKNQFLTIQAHGEDIFQETQEFRFAWVDMSGNFDVVSKTRYPVDGLYKAGLMARSSLDSNGAYVWMRGGGNAGRNYGLWRMDQSGNFNHDAGKAGGEQPGPWMRLVRKGDTFTAYGSKDGSNWKKILTINQDMPTSLHVGIAVTGRGNLRTVNFSGIDGFIPNFLEHYKTKDIGYKHPDTRTFRGRITERNRTQKIVNLTGNGVIEMPQARDIAFSPDGQLAVADDSRDQNIKFFNVDEGTPELDHTLGRKKGVFAGTPGAYGDYKLSGPNALAFDESGNVYVNSGSTSAMTFDHYAHWQTDLRAFSGPEDEGGKLLWNVLGLGFVDAAAFDPEQPEHLYTEVTHVELDYETTPDDPNYEVGSEWNETYDVTRDWFSYDDTRVSGRSNFKQETVVACRNIRGRKYIFLTGMSPTSLGIYRKKNPDSEIFQPVGLIFASDTDSSGVTWPENAPRTNPWIWLDLNNDGQLQENEFATVEEMNNSHGWHIEHDGDIWIPAGKKKLQKLPLSSVHDNGILFYKPETLRGFPVPNEFQQIKDVSYSETDDLMYVAGLKPDTDRSAWKALGDRIVCYENSSSGGPKVKWRTDLPWDDENKPTGFARAGEFLFFGRSRTGHIHVVDRRTGELIGKMVPDSVGGSGWLDVAEPIDAVQRESGEYLVSVEEDWLGRILLYRLSY